MNALLAPRDEAIWEVARAFEAPRSALELLARAEELGQTASGELLLLRADETPLGSVFVEGGRIAWAAARGLGRRLTDLLREASKLPLSKSQLEELVVACRKAGTPLGETLVARGLVEPTQLRTALRQHTAESAIAMLGGAVRSRWIPRPGGYSPKFTFAPEEIAAAVGAVTHGPAARDAEAELDSLLGDEALWAKAFARGAATPRGLSGPLPLSARGEPLGLGAVLAIGRWAADALDSARDIDGKASLYAARTEAGFVVAWERAELLLVAAMDENVFARWLHRRSRGPRPSGS